MKSEVENLLQQNGIRIENIENFINPEEIKSLNLQIFEIVIRAIIEHGGGIVNEEILTLIEKVFGSDFLNRVLDISSNQIN